MPGPHTINWYRADLRSPLPWGLSWPADHLYQSLLFFFPSLFPFFRPPNARFSLLVGMQNGLPAAVLTATIAFISQPHFFPKYSGSHKPVTLIPVLSNRYQVFECFLCTLCYLFVLKSSQFRSSSAAPLPFPLLSNTFASITCYSGWRIITTYFFGPTQ